MVSRHVYVAGHQYRVRLSLRQRVEERRVLHAPEAEGTNRGRPASPAPQLGRKAPVETLVDDDEPDQAVPSGGVSEL